MSITNSHCPEGDLLVEDHFAILNMAVIRPIFLFCNSYYSLVIHTAGVLHFLCVRKLSLCKANWNERRIENKVHRAKERVTWREIKRDRRTDQENKEVQRRQAVRQEICGDSGAVSKELAWASVSFSHGRLEEQIALWDALRFGQLPMGDL